MTAADAGCKIEAGTIPTNDYRKDADTMTDAKTLGDDLKAKVEQEAAAAEADTPDTDTPAPAQTDDDELEGDPEPEPAPEPEPTGRREKSPQEKFQAAFATFVKKAAECFEILPQDVVVAPQPGVVGIMLPGVTEPRVHENYTACETCNGLGKVLTGARTGDPSKDLHVCPDNRCKGNGFWMKQTAVQPPVATGPLAVTSSPAVEGEWAEAPKWMGDPNLAAGH